MSGKSTSVFGIFGAVVVATAIGLAGSRGDIHLFGIPLFLVCGLFAFLVQWLAFIPAFVFQTEKYFDLLGSVTYIVLAVVALLSSSLDVGAILVASMVIVWALRLGTFLFRRVMHAGHDRRFAKIKPDFLRFLMTWTLQGLWVFVTFSAGLAALTSGKAYPFSGLVGVGCALWMVGFLIEVVADRQKSVFRKDPSNKDRFISHGLWAWSRHPNYFGEILLWTGIAVAALPMLEGWQHITLISPLFVFVLLTQISGVRMLEARADKKWGREDDYIEYRRQTPALFPNPFLKASQ